MPSSSLDCENEDFSVFPSSNSGSLPHEAEEMQNRAMNLWQSVNEFIINGLRERPDMFAGAVSKFGTQFMKAKALSENSVLSALHTFNINSFGAKAVRRGRYINVNLAGKVRRKYALMGGRKCTQQGRPPKAAFTSEHGYSMNRRVMPAWDRSSCKSKQAIPHNLSQKVQMQGAKKK